MAAERAALLAAAVKAAVQSKAPRRTVAAVAAAVTTVLLQPVVTAAAQSVAVTSSLPGQQDTSSGNCEELVQRLRAARAAKRRAKRQRRRAEKAAEAETLEEAPCGVSTWDEAARIAEASVGKRKADVDADAAESQTSMSNGTQLGRRRPPLVVDPSTVAQIKDSKFSSTSTTMTKPSPRVVAATPEGKGNMHEAGRSSQQPARRGPY